MADIGAVLKQLNDCWAQLTGELAARLENFPTPSDLIATVDELRTRLTVAEQTIEALRAHIDYSLVREVDLVKLFGNLYYWYTNDVSYKMIGQDPRYVVKNYRLTTADLAPVKSGILDPRRYWDSYERNETIYETNLKHPVFVHLWLNGIDDFVFVDVGANTGTSAIPAGRFFRQHGRSNAIISFEPGVVGDLVVQSVRINQLEDLIRIERSAVSNVDAAVVFRSLLGHSESNSVRDFREFYPDLRLAETRLVPTVRLDTYIRDAGIAAPLVVKIDAEGHDWPVLQGMSGLGPDRVPAIFFEYMPRYLRSETTPEEILRHLAGDYTMITMEGVYGTPLWRYGGVIDVGDLAGFADRVDRSPSGWTDIAAIARSLPGHDELVSRLVAFGAR